MKKLASVRRWHKRDTISEQPLYCVGHANQIVLNGETEPNDPEQLEGDICHSKQGQLDGDVGRIDKVQLDREVRTIVSNIDSKGDDLLDREVEHLDSIEREDYCSTDDDYVGEEDQPADEDSCCDVELVDDDNEIAGDDAELNFKMSIPPTRLDICVERDRSHRTQTETNEEVMGYSFDVETDYEGSDDYESLDEDNHGDKNRFPKFSVKTDMKNPTFKAGMIFPTIQVLKEAIRRYSITTGYQINFKKNDLKRVRAICTNGCPWVLYATPIQGGDKAQIRTYKDQHTCWRGSKNKCATYVWVAHEYLETIRASPEITLTGLQEQVKRDFNILVPTTKLWRAKDLALKLLRGNEKQQFLKLADYGGELRNTNPGSTMILSLDNLVFRRLFICISGCKNGFSAGCRPIISIDGCFLKGRYGGQLLSAVGIDPNDCIWPLAYAVVDVECRETWTWFLRLLSEELGIENSHKWTIMSDRQKGLIQAVQTIFPNAEHRFCVRHLISNFKKKHSGESLKNTVWGAATSTYIGEYKKKMEQLKSLSADAWAWMDGVPADYWSRSHFRVDSKCDILLNNISECFNRFILEARDKPILTMLEIIRSKIMVRIAKKREQMSKWSGKLCPKIKKKVEKMIDESRYSLPLPSGGTNFQVACHAGQFVVDVATHTCSCRKWQLTGIPCPHACATLAYIGYSIEDFVDPCYDVSVCKTVYGNIINAARSLDQWEDLHHNPIKPPSSIPPNQGRPKKKRRREHGEREPTGKMRRFGSVMHCTQCGESGHNKRGCKKGSRQPAHTSQQAQSNVAGSSRRKATD